MNCVLSGNSGLAFVLDGARALIVHANRSDDMEQVPAEEFHRVFAGVTDRIFLEGVSLDEIRGRLLLACQASTALSLALLVLDIESPEDLRAEAAQDLEGLIEDPRVLAELEKVLSAAPLPGTADVVGTEGICKQSSAKIVGDLLARLIARQSHIRMVCAAWDALPPELFESEDNRRAARVVSVREGLFLAMVRYAETGRGFSSFLLESLGKSTMLRSFAPFRTVLKSWSAVLPETVSVVSEPDSVSTSEMVQSDEDDEQIPSRNRGDARFLRPVSRNPGAKLLVDHAIRTFVAALPSACNAGSVAVAQLVTETRERLEVIHTWRAVERPHFIKSISNVAEQLLQHQESASAIELLTWGLRKGLADAVTYSSLVDAWGKAGDAVRAQEVFDAALAAGMADEFTYTALVDAWGRAGEPVQAQRVFNRALTAGHANDITELVLLRALLSTSASREVLTRAVEFLLSRRQLDRVSPSVATMVGWAAARLGRLDWIQSLPARARNARTFYSFALRVAPSNDALVFLQNLGATATAGIITLRYRLLGATAPAAELRSLASECRNLVERIVELDSFSRVRIAETEARCLRTCGAIEDVIASWAPIEDLSIGNRETRASLLAESGRDVLIGGLRHREEGECKRGAQRLMQGWSLARLSDLNDLETLWAASEALSGYADARAEIATAPPELVSVVRPILAEGARDGRWAMEAVRTGDLPDFYLKPALAGMEFLAELKQSLPPRTHGLHAT